MINNLSSILFSISIVPYIYFLIWANEVEEIPRGALWGFRLTLLFVGMSIFAAIIANRYYGAQLFEIDLLHGFAEAFLTLSNAVLVFGLIEGSPSRQKK